MAGNEVIVKTEVESPEDKVVKFNRILATEPLKAPKMFENIVLFQLCWQKLTNQKCFIDSPGYDGVSDPVIQITTQLADFIKKASAYKQRKMAGAVSQLKMLTKILILREFKDTLMESMFSPEVALSSPFQIDQFKVYKKFVLNTELASGANNYGKLGVCEERRDLVDLMDIQLPDGPQIFDIYMSACHTIFLMADGSFYGSGKAQNFLTDGSEEDVCIPRKLDYVKIDSKYMEKLPHCKVTNSSTTFFEFKHNLDLIVGNCRFHGEVRDQGPNWKMVQTVGTKPTTREIEVSLYSAPRKAENKYHISSDGTWLNMANPMKFHDIVLFVCGRRVSIWKFAKTMTICEGGIIYAHCDGTLYKGQLVVGPRSKEDSRAEDEGTDDECLVAFMAEVVLSFAVEKFFVNESGKSFVFYKNPIKPSPVSSILFNIGGTNLAPLPRYRERDEYQPIFAKEILPSFTDLLTRMQEPKFNNQPTSRWTGLPVVMPELAYRVGLHVNPDSDSFFTGLPKCGYALIRGLLTLQHFVRIREDTKIPEVLMSLDHLDADSFKKQLQQAVTDSLHEGQKIKVLVAAADLEEEDGDAREEEILQKANIFFNEMTENITNSLKCLSDLPLKYHRNARDSRFCHEVKLMINEVEAGFQESYEQSSTKIISSEKLTVSHDFVKTAIEDRLRNNDIDAEDPKFKPIRVEAIPVNYYAKGPDEFSRYINSYYIQITSTEFFIRLIDPDLLDFVEDGVLNLNNACINNYKRFERMFAVFFDFPETIEDFQNYKQYSFFENDYVCSRLPESEKYIVSTSDDKKVEVPAYLFQLYSNGFDAARRRNSKGSLETTVEASAKVVKHLSETLMDVPSFYRLDMQTKVDVFSLAHGLLLHHLIPQMIKMIVISATETDHFDTIKEFFKEWSDQMIENIGKYRPDIVLYWKQLPFDPENLNILSEISKLMQIHCFTTQYDAPLTVADDQHVDSEQIDKQWLLEQLSHKEEDEDVKWSLTTSIMRWDGFTKKTDRKRRYCD